MSHTLGPWKVYTNVGQSGKDDARLIAAAPDLLSACEGVCDWWLREGRDQFVGAPAAIFMMRAAIEKAEDK